MTDTLARLRELPDLAVECFITWDTPNPAPRADRHVQSVPGSKPPTDLGAWDALRPDEKGSLEVIRSWTRLIIEERAEQGLGAPLPASDGWAGCCDYLIAVATFWAGAEWRPEFEGEVRKVHRQLEVQARVTIDPVYKCDKCEAIARPQPGRMWMLCDNGHEVRDLGIIRRNLQNAKPMTAEAIEREWGQSLGLRAKTISEWSRRGWLKSRGRVLIDRKWRPFYEPWDVICVQWRHAGAGEYEEAG